MNEKVNDSELLADVETLLRSGIHFNPTEAYQSV